MQASTWRCSLLLQVGINTRRTEDRSSVEGHLLTKQLEVLQSTPHGRGCGRHFESWLSQPKTDVRQRLRHRWRAPRGTCEGTAERRKACDQRRGFAVIMARRMENVGQQIAVGFG